MLLMLVYCRMIKWSLSLCIRPKRHDLHVSVVQAVIQEFLLNFSFVTNIFSFISIIYNRFSVIGLYDMIQVEHIFFFNWSKTNAKLLVTKLQKPEVLVNRLSIDISYYRNVISSIFIFSFYLSIRLIGCPFIFHT
ncbi:hypothetical protein Hanom_Chr15g01358911 [Helianthus anomalus]